MRTFFFEHSPIFDEGYWREPLQPTLSTTRHGQFFKYFNQHIFSSTSTRTRESFYRYAELPAELRLRIIQQCDAPALFQLMQTTRELRIESKMLFFSDQATWYRLPLESFVECCSLAESIYDPHFLASVEQLAIHSPHLNMSTWSPEVGEQTFVSNEERSQFFDEHIEANIKNFWCTVQRFCPQVKRVMFTRDGRSFPDRGLITDCYRRVARLCPQSLDVFFYTTEPAKETFGRRRKRVLWRLRTGNEDMVKGITPTREKHSEAPGMMVVPPQKPHRGRVGDYLKSRTIWHKFAEQHSAAEYYRAAAIEQYHFQGRHQPFGCSVTDCDARFEQPDQYTTHLLATGHDKGETAPGQAGALVTDYTKRLQTLEQKSREASDTFWDWWGDYPSEQRTMAESEVIHQLENDILYAQDKPVAKHAILQELYEVETQMYI